MELVTYYIIKDDKVISTITGSNIKSNISANKINTTIQVGQ